MVRLVRPVMFNAKIAGLILIQFGKLHTQHFQVQGCDFFIQLNCKKREYLIMRMIFLLEKMFVNTPSWEECEHR